MEPVLLGLLPPEDEVHDGWVLATLGTATDGGLLEAATACNGVAVTNDIGRIQTVGFPYTGHGEACRMHHLL